MMKLVEDQAEGPSSSEDLYDPAGPLVLPRNRAAIEAARMSEGHVEM